MSLDYFRIDLWNLHFRKAIKVDFDSIWIDKKVHFLEMHMNTKFKTLTMLINAKSMVLTKQNVAKFNIVTKYKWIPSLKILYKSRITSITRLFLTQILTTMESRHEFKLSILSLKIRIIIFAKCNYSEKIIKYLNEKILILVAFFVNIRNPCLAPWKRQEKRHPS